MVLPKGIRSWRMIFRLLRLLLSDSNNLAAVKPKHPARRSPRPRRQSRPSANDESKHYHQGLYAPKFPEKYRGNAANIIFRSSWEKLAFQWCDLNPRVVAWASEELKGDPEVVMEAVSKSWRALEWASDVLRRASKMWSVRGAASGRSGCCCRAAI